MKWFNGFLLAVLTLQYSACKPRQTASATKSQTTDFSGRPVIVTCANDRAAGQKEPAKYGFALDKLKGFSYSENLDLTRLLDLENNTELVAGFSNIAALKDGNLGKSFSLSEIREIESYGLLCDLNNKKAGFWTTRGTPIFGMPLGRQMAIFAYQPGASTTMMTPFGSVPSTQAGTYKYVGQIPMFTGANLNELVSALPVFRDADQNRANTNAAVLEFMLHIVPYGTAADQIAEKGTLDRDGVVSVFLDTSTVLTMGTIGAAGAVTKFEKAAVYAARVSAAGGVLLGATEIIEKLRQGDRKGAAVATLKVSFIAIANTVALMKQGKELERAASNIIHPVQASKVAQAAEVEGTKTAAQIIQATVTNDVKGLVLLSEKASAALAGGSREELKSLFEQIAKFKLVSDFAKYKPGYYNEAYQNILFALYNTVQKGTDPELQLQAMQALAAFGRAHSGDYVKGYSGRMLADLIPDLAANQKLPQNVLEIAQRENSILYKNLGWGAPKFASLSKPKNPQGFGIPDSIEIVENGHVIPNANSIFFKEELYLITPEQLKALPNGTKLKCIDGKSVVVGVDKIDNDTRGGFLAYGFGKIE